MADNPDMNGAPGGWLRSATLRRVAVPVVVVVLSVAGFIVATHAANVDRRATAERQAKTDAEQIAGLLERAGSLDVGVANALAGERVPNRRRFQALVGSAASSVGLADAMWVESVSARGRPAYERRIGAPITRLPGSRPAAPALSYLPATFVTGLPFPRGVDVSGLPALAATLRNPASIFAGTATAEQTVGGQPGFFLVQNAQFGQGPGSQGFLVIFVPAGWLSVSLNENPHSTAISLNGRRLEGTVGATPGASQSFQALTQRWGVEVAQEPESALQAIVPPFALAWPAATALLIYLIGRLMLRRRRAEREVEDIFDLSGDLLCIVGVDGYVKRANPAFERTLGYDAAELHERPLLEFVHPDDREATTQSIAKLQDGREAEPFESRFLRPDGAVRWLQWNMRPKPERGQMFAAAHDVTDTRMLLDEQAALRRVATLVAHAPAAGDVFTAVTVEVGQLLGADATRLLRYHGDGTTSVVASHGASDAELGLRDRADLEGTHIWGRVARRARPASPDESAETSGSPATSLSSFGIGAAVAAPIVVSGRPWGVIVAAWTRAEMARADTETRMGKFTELVATAVANAESRAELAASRQRIVATADETRQRIERDLHDGAQQRLVSTIVTLKAAQQELGNGSGKAAGLIERALESIESANHEVRELARGIHPAILTKGGLGPALKMIARRSSVPVALDLELDVRLPERTEITAYFVAVEALTNASKHAQASTVHLTVEIVERDLRLSISDDGVGGADPARGSGLVGLRDRVEAAGGTLTVHSPPGEGTQITVELPIAPG